MRVRYASLLLVSLVLSSLAAAQAPPPETRPPEDAAAGAEPPALDPRAEETLRRMSASLGGLRSFRYTGETWTEVVLEDGQKLQIGATAKVAVRRPDRLRSERAGQISDLVLTYDGERISLLGERTRTYAISEAPPTLDEAIDFARDTLGLEAPAADLLFSDPASALTSDVVSGAYLGETLVDGVPCEVIALRSAEVDFQLWIEKGPRALPRRYVIISRDVAQAPEFTVTLRDWELDPELPDSLFEFRPPPDASRIDFFKSSGEAGGGAKEGVQP